MSQAPLQTSPVYLCQVDERLSCSACCGLYNRTDASGNALKQVLENRTVRFHAIERTMESILAFGRDTEKNESNVPPCPDFHHCPFIGLIGDDPSRVGCLLHPQSEGNNGVDFRGLSYYGGMACHAYFCPASRYLEPDIKRIVQYAVDDWYLYGLVITEKTLLESFFAEVRLCLTDPLALTWSRIEGNDAACDAIREFLYLKVNWPFRPTHGHGLCHYFFNDQNHQKPPVSYGYRVTGTGRYQTIFHELVSTFTTPDALNDAEAMVGSLIHRTTQSIVNP